MTFSWDVVFISATDMAAVGGGAGGGGHLHRLPEEGPLPHPLQGHQLWRRGLHFPSGVGDRQGSIRQGEPSSDFALLQRIS